MTHLTFHLETTTPMFVAGAEQHEFELRPPSFKGLLRFWWRAYFWGQQTGGTDKEIQQQMAEKEGRIFGIASENGRKSRCALRIAPSQTTPTRALFPKHAIKTSAGGKSFPINILEYLAYGMHEYQRGHGNQFIRDYLPAQSEFAIHLNITEQRDASDEPHFKVDETIEQNVVTSMYLLSIFGAVGAKSHNGFGSFKITRVTDQHGQEYACPVPLPDMSEQFLKQQIKNEHIPNFTAFSTQMKLFKLKHTCKTWDDCLAELGEAYRSCKGALDEPLSCENRQYIAAPITSQQRVGGRWKIYDASFLERHAKPYFLRVIQNAQQKFDGYILYLPSAYCDGLERDRNHNPINKKRVDDRFKEVCQKFNDKLTGHDKLQNIPLWKTTL